jgi:hypothetical protein
MNCINCAKYEGNLICTRRCSKDKVDMRQSFKMYWRLNAECSWQPAWPIGSSYEDAQASLLLAVKTIYRIGSNDIEIVENLGASNGPLAGGQ